ncbi:MAG: hypothetical protein SynsKO_43820 [Synoicihabitans sp.]
MKSDKKPTSKVTLDDLFALKRAERPPEDFWQDFQRDFHVRQRAEAVEPKRWWFVLPRIFAGFSRYQMPLGASAVLAVTFLSFRDYQEPGFEVAYTSPVPSAVTTPAPVENAVESVTTAALPLEEQIPAEVQFEEVDVQESQLVEAVADTPAEPLELSPMVVWAGPSLNAADVVPATPTPSQRSIAANLATAEAKQVQVGRLLGEPELNLTAAIQKTESLSQITVPQPTRERLFVYQASPEDFTVDRERSSGGRDTHSLIADRISNDELYESVSRVSAGGNHLTLKF